MNVFYFLSFGRIMQKHFFDLLSSRPFRLAALEAISCDDTCACSWVDRKERGRAGGTLYGNPYHATMMVPGGSKGRKRHNLLSFFEGTDFYLNGNIVCVRVRAVDDTTTMDVHGA